MTKNRPEDATLRLDEEFVAEGNEYRLARKKVAKELSEKGIISAPQVVDPEGKAVRPSIPGEFSDLDPPRIVDLLGQYAAWLEFVEHQAAAYSVLQDELERRKSIIRSQIRLRTKGSATDKADAVMNDKMFLDIDLKEFKAKAAKELTEATIRGADRTYSTISRALTAVGIETDRVRREANVAPRRGGEFHDYGDRRVPPDFPHRKRR